MNFYELAKGVRFLARSESFPFTKGGNCKSEDEIARSCGAMIADVLRSNGYARDGGYYPRKRVKITHELWSLSGSL